MAGLNLFLSEKSYEVGGSVEVDKVFRSRKYVQGPPKICTHLRAKPSLARHAPQCSET